nr:vegetative incompatibility protein het-e-1 [Quercus suber]
MSALLHGMNLVLCFANRLQAYFVYFQRLPSALTTDNPRKALVALYSYVLKFLAIAIRTYTADRALRKVQALWQTSDIQTFESQCDKLGGRADIAANNCDRELRAESRAAAAEWKKDLILTLEKLDNIQLVTRSLNVLQMKADLSKLIKVQEATYNSSAEEKLSVCLKGTRSEILHDIEQWIDQPDGKLIYWLCGKAGTGKSTISRTIAQRFVDKQCLGASFFFKRGEQNRSNATHFFSTIAAQLSDLLPHLRVPISAALDKDSMLCGRRLQEQFEKLVLVPVLSIDPADLHPQRVAIVIDALDDKLDSKFHQDIVLEEVQELTIGRDIRVYFNHEFAKIKQDRLLTRPNDALPVDWPSEEDMQMLVNLAVPLFIFASTVCRFLSESKPRERLRSILAQRTSEASQLAKTYAPILDQLLLEKDEEEQVEILTRFRKVVGLIILAADPLSVVSLASLLGMSQDDILDIVDHLHSVLQIPSSSRDPVRLMHLSFRDFLIDPKRKDKDRFWINEAELHGQLAVDCLRRLNELGTFKYDICCVVKPGTRRAQVTAEQIATSIPSDVAYACNYWPEHLIRNGIQLIDDKAEHKFLQEHLLHWLEALTWLGELWSAIYHIHGLMPLAKIYHSAKIFAPTHSIVRKTFCKQVPQLWTCLPRVAACWSAKIVKLNEHDYEVFALTFSPDGQVVASGSNDGTVRLWNAITGEQMQKLEGDVGVVHKVVFSPEGQVLASVSEDATVRLWNTTTGEQTQKLEGHDSRINAVAFSPDEQVFASGSIDGTLWLWNVITGERMQKLEGHSGVILELVFSRDGQVVAGLYAGTIW